MIRQNKMEITQTCSVPRFIHLLKASTHSVPAGALICYQNVNHTRKDVGTCNTGQQMCACQRTNTFMPQNQYVHVRFYFNLSIHITHPSPVSHLYIHFDLSIHKHIKFFMGQSNTRIYTYFTHSVTRQSHMCMPIRKSTHCHTFNICIGPSVYLVHSQPKSVTRLVDCIHA